MHLQKLARMAKSDELTTFQLENDLSPVCNDLFPVCFFLNRLLWLLLLLLLFFEIDVDAFC